MRVAMLGWGSLLWDMRKNMDRGFEHDGIWRDGPELPIEFARCSTGVTGKRTKLTLVICPGAPLIKVFWTLSKKTDISAAIMNLNGREGCKTGGVGFVDFVSGGRKTQQPSVVIDAIERWGQKERARKALFDAVIWTDLGGNFESVTGDHLTPERVMRFLSKLQKNELREAIEYIAMANSRIDTPIRRGVSMETLEEGLK